MWCFFAKPFCGEIKNCALITWTKSKSHSHMHPPQLIPSAKTDTSCGMRLVIPHPKFQDLIGFLQIDHWDELARWASK